jgi:XapX domain-containing protein
MKTAISTVLALLIGAACRRFELPIPSPPSLLGVLLIAGITAGYMVADRWLVK